MSSTEKALHFEPEHKEKIKEICSRYPADYPQAALLPLLHLSQEIFGYISPEVMVLISEELGVAISEIKEVVTFYTMFYEEPKGKYHIQICHNLSCTLMGAESLITYLEKRLGIKSGETTADGRFSLSRMECLGACQEAPMLQLNDKYKLKLTPEKIVTLIDELSA